MSNNGSAEMITRVEEGRELVLERTFRAPREWVFRAFSEPEHLKHWWGPRGWTLTVCNIDFRPGGKWHYCMKCIDEQQGDFYGMESWGLGLYQEIEAPERIVYIDAFSDAEGNVVEGMAQCVSSLIFEEVENGTKVTNRSTYPTEEDLKQVMDMGMLQGITETWDRLDEHLRALG